MKYNVGDKVVVKEYENVKGDKSYFAISMKKYSNTVLTISKVREEDKYYNVEENGFGWRENAFKPLDSKVRRVTNEV